MSTHLNYYQMVKLMKQQLQKHMDENEIQSPHQHGFVRIRSYVANLHLARESWLMSMNQGQDVDVVFTEINKAFDRVDHGVFISVLKGYKFSIQRITWLSDVQ